MTDKEQIKKYLDEIDVRLDYIVEQYKVSEEIRDFLLDLSLGLYDTLSDIKDKAEDLWRQI